MFGWWERTSLRLEVLTCTLFRFFCSLKREEAKVIRGRKRKRAECCLFLGNDYSEGRGERNIAGYYCPLSQEHLSYYYLLENSHSTSTMQKFPALQAMLLYFLFFGYVSYDALHSFLFISHKSLPNNDYPENTDYFLCFSTSELFFLTTTFFLLSTTTFSFFT